MRTEKGYRFTIQFPAKTLAQQQAGEFLERAGSKKGRVVVHALMEYLRSNPDLLEPGGTIHIAAVGLSKEEVRAIIREELARSNPPPLSKASDSPAVVVQEDAVDSMLENIGLFV